MIRVPSYEVIVPSASRPHLLEPSLRSLLERVDRKPQRVLVHDDAAFPGKQDLVVRLCEVLSKDFDVEFVVGTDNPPILHGPSLFWLLERVREPYVLYNQDDQLVIRDLPIAQTLRVMERNALHHVRFNKRATMRFKGGWEKKEILFEVEGDRHAGCETHAWDVHRYLTQEPPHKDNALRYCTTCGAIEQAVLCVSDHWYFQTFLGRTDRLRPVVRWWQQNSESFAEHCEMKINNAMNRGVSDFTAWANANGYDLPTQHCYAMEQFTRAVVQRTYIWGPVGESQFTRNLATNPDDWALPRPRGGHGPARVDSQANG